MNNGLSLRFEEKDDFGWITFTRSFTDLAREPAECPMRPEIRPGKLSFTDSTDQCGSDNFIPAEVEVVEPLGYDTYVICRSHHCSCIVRGGEEGVSWGDSVDLAADSARV